MKRFVSVVAAVAAVVAGCGTASAGILVKVDLGTQQMTVDVDGKRAHVWSVSTARSGFVTPTGSYRPQRMHKMWYSRKYDDAPMPHAIFYSGGYAIHGTTSVGALGRPASHGCVRLAPGNAAKLFALVKDQGMAATKIVIHGVPPKPVHMAKRPQPQPVAYTTSSSQQGFLSELLGWSQPMQMQQPRVRVAPVAAQQPVRMPQRPRPAPRG